MRVLITGANGMVGKEIVYLLSKVKKYKLFLFTNKRVKKSKKKIKLFYQDLAKPINYKFRIDAIIHCASNELVLFHQTLNLMYAGTLFWKLNADYLLKLYSLRFYPIYRNSLLFSIIWQKPVKALSLALLASCPC